MPHKQLQGTPGLSRRDIVHHALVLAAAGLTAPIAGPGSGNERSIVDLDCRNHGYVVSDVTKTDFQVAMTRIAPSAFVPTFAEAKAEVGLKYRVSAGDPEPRKA